MTCIVSNGNAATGISLKLSFFIQRRLVSLDAALGARVKA